MFGRDAKNKRAIRLVIAQRRSMRGNESITGLLQSSSARDVNVIGPFFDDHHYLISFVFYFGGPFFCFHFLQRCDGNGAALRMHWMRLVHLCYYFSPVNLFGLRFFVFHSILCAHNILCLLLFIKWCLAGGFFRTYATLTRQYFAFNFATFFRSNITQYFFFGFGERIKKPNKNYIHVDITDLKWMKTHWS